MIYTIVIDPPDDLTAFRSAARRLLAVGAEPADIAWTESVDGTLFGASPPEAQATLSVPRAFIALADSVACHRDPERWALLYQVLFRLAGGEADLMHRTHDPLLHRLHRMASAVRRDRHRMTAFVRFRETRDEDGPRLAAWYEPQYRIVRQTSAFFIDRFASLRFSILTPDLTLHWDGRNAAYTGGLTRRDAPPEDAMEAWWQRYYAAIFNPARSNPDLLNTHMPKRFRHNLPEAGIINDLLRGAESRTDRMVRPPPEDR